MSIHDGKDSSSASPRMSSKSRKSRSRSYDPDLSPSRSRSRDRSKVKDDCSGKRSWVVFVRNLHESVTGEDLRKHFEDCGPVIDASVIRDRKTKHLKGFGFVAFESEEGQKRAIQSKNGTSFFDKNLVVQVSTRKTTIYVGNLPWDFSTDKDAEDLQKVVEDRCGKRVLSTRLKGRYAFCEFINFEHTQAALKKLPGLVFRGREIRVQLANSMRAEENLMSSENVKKTLFIRNISTHVTERELRNHFEKYGELTRCEIIRDRAGEQREYGFVAYRERSQTDLAYREMHRAPLGGREICVEYARSKDKEKDRRRRNDRSDRSRSRDSHRNYRRRDPDSSSRRQVSRSTITRNDIRASKLEIDEVLARGWPVLAYDTSVGRMVLLSSDCKRMMRQSRGRRRYD